VKRHGGSWKAKKQGFLGHSKSIFGLLGNQKERTFWEIKSEGSLREEKHKKRKKGEKGSKKKKRLYSHVILYWRGKRLKKRSNKSL